MLVSRGACKREVREKTNKNKKNLTEGITISHVVIRVKDRKGIERIKCVCACECACHCPLYACVDFLTLKNNGKLSRKKIRIMIVIEKGRTPLSFFFFRFKIYAAIYHLVYTLKIS